MKRIIAFLLLLAMMLVLVSCGGGEKNKDEKTTATNDDTSNIEVTEPVTEPDETGITPLLYKVTDDDGDVIWLFGSIHVGTEDYYPLPDYVMDAFEESDALAVEFDVVAYEKDLMAQINSMKPLVYSDGSTINDYLSEEVYTRAVEIMEENGIYDNLFDYYMPSVWQSFISQCMMKKLNVDSDMGVDKHMINKAYEAEKDVLDIESAEFQLGMLAGFSTELQVKLLEESVDAYDDLEAAGEELNRLISCWTSGDEEGIVEYLASDLPDISEDPEEYALYEEYNEAFILGRNNAMTVYASDALKAGDELFICVGAAHVMGETGMAAQLRDLGYKVEAIKQ